MAPLDTGSVMNMRLVDPLGERFGPSPADYDTIGSYLRAVREHKLLSLQQVANTTRIHKDFLRGIEEGDRSAQPSRPFAIGYVRSYAQMLGIDGDAAASRFKAETPDQTEPLRNPVGVQHDDKPKRSPLIFALIGLVVSGVVLWNVVQRTLMQEEREMPAMPAAADNAAAPAPAAGPITLGVATPAPAEQNLPTPYKTPGIDGPAYKPVDTATATADASAIRTAANPVFVPASTFQPKGAVYGAPTTAPSAVVLQAHKAASLIVRGANGSVYFARQLASGEAYRAPLGEGLSAEVSDPSAFDLYVGGEIKGVLVSEQTALDKLVARAKS
jgi:cytoskeletal protein RodZ